ncbi:MAG: hypothetical protein BWY95_01936 [Bacteroidetes bacterium ADurb.BinA104]|nr:MAG: hypothetical protein BWY95_01936 [Bacteroidetes bacterium ADurb.BinA104]
MSLEHVDGRTYGDLVGMQQNAEQDIGFDLGHFAFMVDILALVQQCEHVLIGFDILVDPEPQSPFFTFTPELE